MKQYEKEELRRQDIINKLKPLTITLEDKKQTKSPYFTRVGGTRRQSNLGLIGK